MSRSGYTDDCANLALWRGTIASATRGKRGQAFFRSLVEALDAMPEKRLIADDLETAEGDVCALGAVARSRQLDMEGTARVMRNEDFEALGYAFNIAEQLAQEVMYENDEGLQAWRHGAETPEDRWARMRAWAAKQVRP